MSVTLPSQNAPSGALAESGSALTPRPDRVHLPSASWMKIELWPVPNVASKNSDGLSTPVADSDML